MQLLLSLLPYNSGILLFHKPILLQVASTIRHQWEYLPDLAGPWARVITGKAIHINAGNTGNILLLFILAVLLLNM
jgi:hypothetical protein